jgi:hypothetical protein
MKTGGELTMVTPRLTVSLSPEEQRTLEALCEQDRRPPKYAVRWLIQEEAQRRGLTAAVKSTNGKRAAEAVEADGALAE